MDRVSVRRDKLRQSLVSQQVDAYLVTSEVNVCYLTGFTGDSSALIVTVEGEVLVSDSRYTTQLAQECPGLPLQIRDVGKLLHDGIAAAVESLKVRTLGFEAHILSVSTLQTLKELLPGVVFTSLVPKVEPLRMIKDEEELAAIRRSISIAERAFTMIKAGLRPEDSEKDIADLLESYLRRCGAVSAAFPPIVAVGSRAALPHATPTANTRIDDDGFLLIDWGATDGRPGQPYKSDLTRMIVTGKVTPKFEEIYQTVLKAQERGIASIRPGVSAREVDAQARSVIDDAGYGQFFEHGLGHGFGLEIHESPRFHRESDIILQAGMVVTVEPGIYLPGWGGIRIEDDILVTPCGSEALTTLPKSLESARI